MHTNRQQRRVLEAENRRHPAALLRVDESKWPAFRPQKITEVWRSRDFLVQIFREMDGIERMSVSRTQVTSGDWVDGITWDDLQRLKRECGRGDKDAVEIFPADADVVNVANMRHLWILPDAIKFKWHKHKED